MTLWKKVENFLFLVFQTHFTIILLWIWFVYDCKVEVAIKGYCGNPKRFSLPSNSVRITTVVEREKKNSLNVQFKSNYQFKKYGSVNTMSRMRRSKFWETLRCIAADLFRVRKKNFCWTKFVFQERFVVMAARAFLNEVSGKVPFTLASVGSIQNLPPLVVVE